MKETKIIWHQWSKTAFQRAKKLDKPIVLDISAVWCHWCHVMDQITYSDPQVTELIMKNCVPIRVDRDLILTDAIIWAVGPQPLF
jgi:uncharacterized protein YyaL (SSP411 family)